MKTCKVGDIVMEADTRSREQYTVIEIYEEDGAGDPVVLCERRTKPGTRSAQNHVIFAFMMSEIDTGRIVIVKRVK